MEVTPGKELEAFSLETKDDPAENDSQELGELLLAAVRGPHRPLTAKEFDQLRLRARGQAVW